MNYTGCQCSSELNARHVWLSKSACMEGHLPTWLRCALSLSKNWTMSYTFLSTRRPGSSSAERHEKFSCVWSAAVELSTTNCSWSLSVIDTVLFSSQDINIAPPWQFLLYINLHTYLLTVHRWYTFTMSNWLIIG